MNNNEDDEEEDEDSLEMPLFTSSNLTNKNKESKQVDFNDSLELNDERPDTEGSKLFSSGLTSDTCNMNNNTITSITAIGSQHEHNYESITQNGEITFSITSFPSLTSSNSSSASNNINNSSNLIKKDIRVDCELTSDTNSSSLSSPAPSVSSSSNPLSNSSKEEITKPFNSVSNRNDFQSQIPIIKTLQKQKILPEINSKFQSPQLRIARNLFDKTGKISGNNLLEERQRFGSVNSLNGNHVETKKSPVRSNGDRTCNVITVPKSISYTDLVGDELKSTEIQVEEIKTEINETNNTQPQASQANLHKHVCSIANKCTCEKKFLVDKIGEGKYRIGNTKNIVFIRVCI